MKRWFAVLSGPIGYALDFFPEEERRYRRELGKAIIGTFDTMEEANDAIIKRFGGSNG